MEDCSRRVLATALLGVAAQPAAAIHNGATLD
jgi:hypothetical protein